MNLCDKNELSALLARHGFHFSKALGQNFLIEEWVPRRIAEEAGIEEGTGVVEIGPGVGCLTRELAARAHAVTALELDRRLLPLLAESLHERPNVRVVNGDVLKTDLKALCEESFGDAPCVACANLPYYITTPAISALIECRAFRQITVMVQKEVAERIVAAPGSAAYGAFGVYVNYHAAPEILFGVDSACFLPRPKVDSAVLRLTVREAPAVCVKDEKLLFRVIKAAFGQRRKTLVNALAAGFSQQFAKSDIATCISACGIAENIRGERLALGDFARLADWMYENIK